ncbi:hypothetical protein D0U00_04435 [Leclercia adecarboxylata]|uniref:hypothetical protein n=1 Tax=Leclercia adecarboxylata TaxID=83655 RepID=UPI000E3D9828|nr:hypothetical protein [Leclercia adecarboxylata]RFS80919.1 hypothetical protein D0U00_04435 [Leclercia adecarboxylata]
MKRLIIVTIAGLSLIGCGKPAPTEDEAFQLAKKEMSMALCGDKSASCFSVEGGSAKVSERKNDNTYNASATFKTIKGKGKRLDYNGGLVSFQIDADTHAVYVQSIEAWSEDGNKTIALCGRDYKFCR